VPDLEQRSPALRDVLRRFFELSTTEQLVAHQEIRQHLAAGTWVDSEEERVIDRKAEALEALKQAASELRRRGQLDLGKAPTAKQFDEAAITSGSEWRSGQVIRAFGSWRNAKRALLGGSVRESPAQARARARRVGRTRSHEEPIEAVRLWLATEPEAFRLVDYAAFVAEANKKRAKTSPSKPLPSWQAVEGSLRLGWEAILGVARGEKTLEEAQQSQRSQLLEGLTDKSLVGTDVALLVLDVQTCNLSQAIKRDDFPQPVAKVGRNRAWMLGDLKKYRDKERVPRRRELALQEKVLDAPALASAMGIALDYLRTLLSRERWDRVPKPAGRVGQNHYWLRQDIKQWLPKPNPAAPSR